MRRLRYCIITFLVLCLLFSGTYYFSYRKALKHFNENAIQKETNFADKVLEENQTTKGEQSFVFDESLSNYESSLAVDTASDYRLKQGTKYILETYDVVQNTLVKEELAMPPEYLGLNRQEVIKMLTEYMQDVPLVDYEKGLASYELLNFSEEEIIVRKTFNQELVPDRFYLALRGGFVVVFYSDLETIFQYTDINALDLPDEEKDQLAKGFYVKDLDTLYSILEAYTS